MLEKILQKNEEVVNYFYFINKLIVYIGSSFLAFRIRMGTEKIYDYVLVTFVFIVIIFLLETLILRKNKFYKNDFKSIYTDIKSFLISVLILIFIATVFKITQNYSRIWLGLFIIFCIIFIFIHKLLFNYFYNKLVTANLFIKNILLIGNFDQCLNLIKDFKNDNKFHFRACIFIDKNKDKKLFPIQEIVLDQNIFHNVKYYNISQIWILASENFERKKIMNKLNSLPIDIRTIHLSDGHNDSLIDRLHGYDIFDTSLSPFYGFNYIFKLLFDYLLAIIFLIISFPIILIFGLIIFIEDGRPIFFIQKRHGWDGSIIKIIKLRSLRKSNHKSQVTKNDERVLKIGKFIRRFSIDELPQFINVLKGDMSIVGPRPHALEHNDLFSQQIKGFMKRHKCKPGLTGLAQMKGFRGNIDNKEKLAKRYEYDMLYIKKWTPIYDFYLIAQTVLKLLFQKAH